jgi:hypothetical protein
VPLKVATVVRVAAWSARPAPRMQNAETAVAASRRWREGKPISTSRAESLVNTLFNARMNKRRQMRWSARGAHRALQVRAAVQDNRFHTAITTIAA